MKKEIFRMCEHIVLIHVLIRLRRNEMSFADWYRNIVFRLQKISKRMNAGRRSKGKGVYSASESIWRTAAGQQGFIYK